MLTYQQQNLKPMVVTADNMILLGCFQALIKEGGFVKFQSLILVLFHSKADQGNLQLIINKQMINQTRVLYTEIQI